MRAHRLVTYLLMTLLVSCSLDGQEHAVLGCYEVQVDYKSEAAWPPLRFTDQRVEYLGRSWQQILSLNTARPLTGHTLWRFENDALNVTFTPGNSAMSDNAGSAAVLTQPIPATSAQ